MTTTSEVRLTGWRPGIKTISLIDLLRSVTSMSLTAAKQTVDGILDGQTHAVSFSSVEDAIAFRSAAEGLGALTEATLSSNEARAMPNP